MWPVDSGAMTDSVITDACQPADTSHVTIQPSHDNAQPCGEFDGNSHIHDAVPTDEDTAAKTNCHAGHSDVKDRLTEKLQPTGVAVSHGNVNGPKYVATDTDCTKLPSTDLRPNGCSGPNLGNSSPATMPLLTNGHVNMWFHFFLLELSVFFGQF